MTTTGGGAAFFKRGAQSTPPVSRRALCPDPVSLPLAAARRLEPVADRDEHRRSLHSLDANNANEHRRSLHSLAANEHHLGLVFLLPGKNGREGRSTGKIVVHGESSCE